MSETLRGIFAEHETEGNEILVVDAVITYRKILNDRSAEKPATIRIIKKALLFKGAAAYVLWNQGL